MRYCFTYHAQERMKCFRLGFGQARHLIMSGVEDEMQHHSKKEEGVKTIRNGTYLFVVNFNHKVPVVITVYDQRLDLPAECL